MPTLPKISFEYFICFESYSVCKPLSHFSHTVDVAKKLYRQQLH